MGEVGRYLEGPCFDLFTNPSFPFASLCCPALSSWLPVNSLRLPREGYLPVPPSSPWTPSPPLLSPLLPSPLSSSNISQHPVEFSIISYPLSPSSSMPKSVWIFSTPPHCPPTCPILISVFILLLQSPHCCSNMSEGKGGDQHMVTPKRHLDDVSDF